MLIYNGENKCSKTKAIQGTKKIRGSEILGKETIILLSNLLVTVMWISTFYRNICKKINLKQFLDNECSSTRNVK